jgi:hypothetical protein
MQINISESTVRRKRKETLEYVYKYMNTWFEQSMCEAQGENFKWKI